MALDEQAGVYLTGYSREFPTTPGAYDTISGSEDAFVTKLEMPAPAYARPLSAGRLSAPLVIAFAPCTNPNREHGPPLLGSSCHPPVPASGHLTVGAEFAGSVRVSAIAGNPGTTADEADVRLRVSLTDVWSGAGPADYTGELVSSQTVRLTDRWSGSLPPNDPATAEDHTFAFPLSCTATPDPDAGSTCAIDTTADAVTPGLVAEGKRAIWQLGPLQVFDGGSDGVAATEPNTLFATQGLFAP
jgi:hypothetical protein